jgi:hypothetical protein
MEANRVRNTQSVETRLTLLEMENETIQRRLDEHEPIVRDYGNRNIVFRLIGIITLINLLLLLARSV